MTMSLNMNNMIDTARLNDDAYLDSRYLSYSRKGDFTILKYKKEHLQEDENLGLFRSVIYRGDKMVCYSPPKSYTMDFKTQESIFGETIRYEEYVEGTMINVFHDGDEWRIATRSILDATTTFRVEHSDREENLSFAEMFEDAKRETNLSFDLLDYRYCYSFVLQHPKNRIVGMVPKPHLVLCAMYQIENNNVKEIAIYDNPECEIMFRKATVTIPKMYPNFNTIQEARCVFGSNYTGYSFQGIVLKIGDRRYKIRNPNYNYVHNLRGNQSKLQYHYYCLRRNQNKVFEFLGFFPEYKATFEKYENELQCFTIRLLEHYAKCFIEKKTVLKDNPYELKNHLFNIHQIYLQSRNTIRYNNIAYYLQQIEPARLMYSINYTKRQQPVACT